MPKDYSKNKSYFCAARVTKIKEDFSFKAYVQLGFDASMEQKFALKGVDFSKKNTARGRKILAHMTHVFEQPECIVFKVYQKNAVLHYLVDVFYIPGEGDPEKIIKKGRLLNQELLDLDLVQPYDAKKRELDFTKGIVKAYDRELDLVTGNFKTEVCMYISDCKQYLNASLEGRAVDMLEDEQFAPTDEEFLIIYGLKELKGLCMQAAGQQGLDWKD